MAKRNSLFLKTLEGERSNLPPIWFMRQAGRYLPEYRRLREKAGSFLNLCFNPTLAAEATLQPVRRFDVDAAILFADILLIPYALGQGLTFETGDGPKLEPVNDMGALERFNGRDVVLELESVFETLRLAREGLGDGKALIGFAGAPWTVATYMLSGGSMGDPSVLREQYYRDQAFIDALIDLLAEKTVDYLIAQIDAGADAVQLFDSWAGGLPWPVLEAVSVRPLERISAAVKRAHPQTRIILFPKGVGEKAAYYAALPGCDGVSIDTAMDPAWARANLSGSAVVQGGLDPLLVVAGGRMMEEAAGAYLQRFRDVPYVFNLGHGLTPQTPPEHVARLVEFVRKPVR
jgi:uroporphyrinogen decarboxylase